MTEESDPMAWFPRFNPPDALPELAPFDAQERVALAWTQPRRLGAEWRLTAGDRVVAVLSGPGRLWIPVRLTTAEGAFELRPQLWKGVAIAPLGGEPFARVHAQMFGTGRVEVDGERRYTLRRVGFFAADWELRTLDELPLVHMTLRRTFLRVSADIALEDAGRRIARLTEILAVCWFAILNTRRNTH